MKKKKIIYNFYILNLKPFKIKFIFYLLNFFFYKNVKLSGIKTTIF